MRLPLALLLLLLLALPAQASPKHVLRAIASHVTLDFAAGASSGLASRAGYDCRARNGPSPCAMHYGSLREFAISNAALTGLAIGLSEYGRKRGFKEWFVPALAMTGANTGFAISQWRKKALRNEH